MPHLAAVTGFRLAVKVKFHTRNSEHRIPVRLLQSISRFPGISENIQHYGRGKQRGVAERESRHRANLLLKLARHAGFDRRVTGVMRTRSGLIGDNRTVFKNEEFDAEHADILQAVRNADGVKAGFSLSVFRNSGRKHGFRENAVLMMVFKHREGGAFTIKSAADDHGAFGLQLKLLLENAVDGTE